MATAVLLAAFAAREEGERDTAPRLGFLRGVTPLKKAALLPRNRYKETFIGDFL